RHRPPRRGRPQGPDRLRGRPPGGTLMSTCELTGASGSGQPATGSRVLRFRPGATAADPHAWQGVPVTDYKQAARHHSGVTRALLVGGRGEGTAFHVRYFEVAPGGFTTLERHAHEHVVVVPR